MENRQLVIEEMPQGCYLFARDDISILISSPDDALEIILSLIRMIRIQFPHRYRELQKMLRKEIADFMI